MSAAPENPWATEQGRAARAELLRRVAEGEGELAEYAREVLAGRVEARMLLYSSVLSDEAMNTMHRMADQWNALPGDQREAMVADADAQLRERIAALAEAADGAGDDRLSPPEEDEEEPAWPLGPHPR
jgi:hypothetical protein